MKRESTSYVVIAALLLVAAGCTDSGITEPEEKTPPIVYTGLEIEYTADPGSAESGEIIPETGGTVSATGPNGVSYELVVSPGAVGSATTITITPLSELTIGIEDSSAIDTSRCLTGALFEPDGLRFDSTALLTITYPPGGLDCQLSGAFCIVHIDSAESFYEIIPTAFNAPSFTCTLTHFSGYGTDDPDYDFLEYLIEEASKAGQLSPGDDILAKLMSYAAQASAMGWDDLRDLARQGCYPVLNHLANGAIAAAAADPGESTLAVLRHYLDPAQTMGLTDIESRLLSAMDTLVRAVAQQGHEKCQQGQHAEGRTMLDWALDLALEGIVADPAFVEQLETWLSSCGDAEVTLTCNRSSVFDISLTTADTTAVAIFDVAVTNYGGEPMEGLVVWVQKYMPAEDRWRAFGGGTSDADGNVKTFFIYGRVPEQWEPEGTGTFKAYAVIGEERIYSDTLNVELVRRRFTMDYDYSMDYYRNDGGGRTIEESGSVHAEGTWWIGYDIHACNPVTRIYSSESRDPSCIETWTLIDDAGLRSCFFSVISKEENVSIDGLQVQLKVLEYVNVIYTYPQYPATMHVQKVCGATTIRDEIIRDLYVFVGGFREELWPEPGSFPLFEYIHDSGFEPYVFGGITEDGNGRSVLSIEITVDNRYMRQMNSP